jgi:protein-tyrosine phosphatase
MEVVALRKLRRIVALGFVAALVHPAIAPGTAQAGATCGATTAIAGTAPAVIGSATAEDNGPGSYRLGWTATAATGTYSIYASTDPDRPACSGHVVARTTGNSVTVDNLTPGKRWYFEIVSAGRRGGMVTSTRVVPIDGVQNTRDLGGYPTADGHTVKWGVVFRSANLAAATDTGVTQLAALGLRTVIDHRGDGEVAFFGPDRIPAGARLDRHPMTMPAPVTEEINLENYRIQVSDPVLRQAVSATIAEIGAGRRPVLINCSAGVDRVGWISAVLLEILGVPHDQVVDDYLLSNQTLGHELAKVELLETSYSTANQLYGSFTGFVQNGLGLNDAAIAALRARLLS